MRKILITNDDGIDSDGIIRLAKAATEYGEVWVVAPDGQRSAMSHSVTLRHPVEMWPVDFPVEGVHAYASSGTPVDCVRIGVLNIVPGKPDVLLTGINYGYNTGTDLQYSATVNAALEGSFQQIHSIAFAEDMSEMHEVTDKYLSDILGELLELPLSIDQVWNVNFPGCPLAECKGLMWDVTVAHEVFFKDHYEVVGEEKGRVSYQCTGVKQFDAAAGSDLRAILDNYVAIGKVTNLS